jgi:maleylpyruvate isomerase
VSDVPDVTSDVLGARAATDRLLATIEVLDDAVVRAPSLLPNWSVAHVLTHLARNADSHARLLRGALQGRSVDRYAGGAQQRNNEIEVGASRPAATCVADVRDTAAVLDGLWNEMTTASWVVVGRSIDRDEPAHRLPWMRWRELEVHHADLGLASFTTSDWSRDYVRRELRFAEMAWRASHPMGMTPLPAAALRLAPHDRLAWLLGRLTIEGLPTVSQWW